jgi:myo-inositol-1(or 4)-monophosphatase
MDRHNLSQYLEFALRLAQASGELILPYFRTQLQIENKGSSLDYQPVTLADRSAEEFIRGRLAERFPEHAISGEELGHATSDQRCTWLIDPIDGTRNFVLGLLHWGTMIALNDGERPVLGVVYQPYVGESFVACIPGRAQWRRGSVATTLSCRTCATLAEASVAVSDPAQFGNPRERRALSAMRRYARDVRYGAECYGACLLASGLIDVVLDVNLDAYDVQPLVPIIEAAGGVISDWDGHPCYAGGSIIACSTARLQAQVLDLIA